MNKWMNGIARINFNKYANIVFASGKMNEGMESQLVRLHNKGDENNIDFVSYFSLILQLWKWKSH